MPRLQLKLFNAAHVVIIVQIACAPAKRTLLFKAKRTTAEFLPRYGRSLCQHLGVCVRALQVQLCIDKGHAQPPDLIMQLGHLCCARLQLLLQRNLRILQYPRSFLRWDARVGKVPCTNFSVIHGQSLLFLCIGAAPG